MTGKDRQSGIAASCSQLWKDKVGPAPNTQRRTIVVSSWRRRVPSIWREESPECTKARAVKVAPQKVTSRNRTSLGPEVDKEFTVELRLGSSSFLPQSATRSITVDPCRKLDVVSGCGTRRFLFSSSSAFLPLFSQSCLYPASYRFQTSALPFQISAICPFNPCFCASSSSGFS